MARKKNGFSTRVITMFLVFITGILMYRLYNLNQAYDSLEIENEKMEALLAEEKAREEELSSNYSKISDPEYLTAYAREQLLYSDNGSIVIILPEDDEEEEEE